MNVKPAPHRPLVIGKTPGQFQHLDLSPPRIFAMGLTYAAHCQETGEAIQRIVFEKRCRPSTAESVKSPDEAELYSVLAKLDPSLANWMRRKNLFSTALLDYEVELGLVLLDDLSGEQLKTPDCPLPLGFFLANDVTARLIQICGEGTSNRLDYWHASKGFSGFLPVSQQMWVPDFSSSSFEANGLLSTTLSTRVNDQLRQSSSTLDLIYSPQQMLNMVIESFDLQKLPRGTWLLTGTPSGIALNATARQRKVLALLSRLSRKSAIRLAVTVNKNKSSFLKPEDQITCTAEQAFSISNVIRR